MGFVVERTLSATLVAIEGCVFDRSFIKITNIGTGKFESV